MPEGVEASAWTPRFSGLVPRANASATCHTCKNLVERGDLRLARIGEARQIRQIACRGKPQVTIVLIEAVPQLFDIRWDKSTNSRIEFVMHKVPGVIVRMVQPEHMA